ncbi:MAG TPA: hypothetical protein EYO33_24635 [Phycisphaerales bacterium]|nr:hypothetical protein [Phycisphaerales bacterium]
MANYLTSFDISHELMAIFRPMADPSGVGDLEHEWPNNLLSTQTVIFEDGKFAKYPETVRHLVDREELETCRKLAHELEVRACGIELQSETACPLQGFYITKNVDSPTPKEFTPDLVSELFAHNFFPLAPITVEPLREDTDWWTTEVGTEEDEEDEEYAEFMLLWRDLIEWINGHDQLFDPVFVKVGDDSLMWELNREQFPAGTEMVGSLFPRLILARTANGSVIGLAAYSVLT